MPNDMIGMLLKTLGMGDPRYAEQGDGEAAMPMNKSTPKGNRLDDRFDEALYELGAQEGISHTPAEEILTILLGENSPTETDALGPPQQQAPQRQQQNGPRLFESPLFQEAVEVFIETNGYEPATDSDFEGQGGVLDIMMQLQQGGGDPKDRIFEQMGEDTSEDEAERARRQELDKPGSRNR